MRILIVNDDGIDAPGLAHLACAAARFGDVYLCAPASHCSGMSGSLTLKKEIRVRNAGGSFPYAKAAYSALGTPVDCVKLMLSCFMEERPDYLLSGINNGWNTGFETAYSGTVAAAMEGLRSGIPSAAFSVAAGASYEICDRHLPSLLPEVFDLPLKDAVWNLNFPGGPASSCRGILRDRASAKLQYVRDLYRVSSCGDGSFICREEGLPLREDESPEGSDLSAVLHGYISVGTLPCAELL